jgi:adenosyl cobinamide kinase/adenosyl cobinamide phosphate guanylyltransferase
MTLAGLHHALVLGGIRSGKSEYAEDLVAGGSAVTYVATARRDPADPEWEARIDAHRARRRAGWRTVEIGADTAALPNVLTSADAVETLLVDDLGTWVAAAMTDAPRLLGTPLATAVSACSATLVLVSPEVGLSVVPATAAGRAFADALGMTNRAVAAACDTVTLVIAGIPVRVKP